MAKRFVEREADRIAAQARLNGYPDAEPSYMYCIDEVGPDNYYTRTVCVYLGERNEEAVERAKRRDRILDRVVTIGLLAGIAVAILLFASALVDI